MLAFATTACTKKSNDYVIMLKNHERALHVNAAGKVTAADMSLAHSLFFIESFPELGIGSFSKFKINSNQWIRRFDNLEKAPAHCAKPARRTCLARRTCQSVGIKLNIILAANGFVPEWHDRFQRQSNHHCSERMDSGLKCCEAINVAKDDIFLLTCRLEGLMKEFFTMESIGDIFSETFKIALFVKEVGRYLCFRRGKLVGLS
uniref:Uncharacterized protein n=1 Tax=Glossina pallidipes TaxID=7398 RepID=A0A1A9ZWN5_GLOPL